MCRQFVLEYLPPKTTDAALTARRHLFNSWTNRRPSQVDGDTWHHRLGHPGPEALHQTIKTMVGGKVRGPALVEYEECAKSKMMKQIRRAPRPVDESDLSPAYRISLDIHDFKTLGKAKVRHLLLLTDRYSGYHWDYYLPKRESSFIVACLDDFLKQMDRQNGLKPSIIECDNEVRNAITRFLRSKGIKVEPSAPHTPSQNGLAERAARHIKQRILSMRTASKLPAALWPEIARCAVYLTNRIS
jgi:hypothetical protein